MHAQAHCLAHQVCLSFILSLFVCGSRGREREREKLDEKLMMILFPAFPFIYYIFISVLREYFGANNCDIYTCPVCVHTNRRWWRKISEQTVKWFWSVYTSKWTTITKTKAKTNPAIDHLSVHCVLVCSMFDLQHFVGVCVLGKDWKWNGWTIPSFVRSFQPTIWMPLKNICHEKKTLSHRHTSAAGMQFSDEGCLACLNEITSREKDYSLFNVARCAFGLFCRWDQCIRVRQTERDSQPNTHFKYRTQLRPQQNSEYKMVCFHFFFNENFWKKRCITTEQNRTEQVKVIVINRCRFL